LSYPDAWYFAGGIAEFLLHGEDSEAAPSCIGEVQATSPSSRGAGDVR
jgi:hypothetical protein